MGPLASKIGSLIMHEEESTPETENPDCGSEQPCADSESDEASGPSPEESLRAELAEAIEARQRALADFQNFQRRSLENEKRATAAGRMDVIRPLLGVLDQVDLALSQDPDAVSVEAMFSGVQLVRDEMCRVLDGQGVVPIDPEPGTDFDAHHHQAVVHEKSDDIAEGCVIRLLQIGWAHGDMVLRPAVVAVSSGVDSESD